MQCFCFFSVSEDSFFSQTFCMIRKIDNDGIPISEPVSHFIPKEVGIEYGIVIGVKEFFFGVGR